MALYTIFAWTAIVIVGGAYYWIYIRQAPLPTHLLGITPSSHSGDSTGEGVSVASSSSSQKRKRKTGGVKRRPAASQTNDGTSGISADESNSEAQSRQQIQDERKGVVEKKSLKIDVEPRKLETHFTSSDADESDTLDTPTPHPSKKPTTVSGDSLLTHSRNAAESRFERITPKTAVDDMIPPEDRPAVARVLRISSPSSDQSAPMTSSGFTNTRTSGPAVDSDGLTKKQRQNQKKKERHREARAREEAIRQSQLRAHQKELETIRLNSLIKAAEKKSSQPPVNAWQQTGRPAMEDSVYTIRNLSEENLMILGHRSDGAASEEGWQEVTSRGTKKAASKSGNEKGGTDGSEDISSIEGSEEGSGLRVRPAYASSNSFANLES